MSKKNTKAKSGIALLPFLFFIGLYLGVGLYWQQQGVAMAFYQFPAPVAMAMSVVVAMLLFKGSLSNKIDTFIEGVGQYEIIYMCLIYLLSGAFAAVTKEMGGVDATAHLGLRFISPQWLIVGVFVLTSFISTATGTSVGSIATITPIAVELASQSGSSLLYISSAVMGGAMFGDNLSLISDTTIASSRTQGAQVNRVFKQSARYAIPAATIAMGLFWWFGGSGKMIPTSSEITEPMKVLPYLVVFGMAIGGINVMITLVVGITLSGLIGVGYASFDALDMGGIIWGGFTNMSEIFLLSLLTGGLSFMVIQMGGIAWLLDKLKSFIVGRRSAEATISIIAAASDIALANNTIAILMSGEVAKEIASKYKISPERSAALIDTFSCILQGMLPYGAQMLILTGFAQTSVSPFSLLPILFYQIAQMILIGLSIVGIDIGVWLDILLRSEKKQEK